MLERGTRSLGTTSVMSKVAFNAGSSQHGKQRRASVASNWVTAEYLSSPFTLCGHERNSVCPWGGLKTIKNKAKLQIKAITLLLLQQRWGKKINDVQSKYFWKINKYWTNKSYKEWKKKSHQQVSSTHFTVPRQQARHLKFVSKTMRF